MHDADTKLLASFAFGLAMLSVATTSCGANEGGGTSNPGVTAGGAGGAGSGATGGKAGATGGGAGVGTGGGSSGSAGTPGTGGTGGGVGTGGTGGSVGGAGGSGAGPTVSTEPNLKIALMGDQGAGTNPRAVYRLALDEGAHFVFALGDFDYEDNPDLWDSDINAVLGDSYPVFGVVGNHDTAQWAGYQQKLTTRLAKITGAQCQGDVGNMTNCLYRGLRFLTTGVGTLGTRTTHEQWLETTLAADTSSVWKLCVWHKNQRDMQAGDKSDEVGWRAFQICQQHGALIMMGHEHSYARTKTLTNIGNASMGHGATGTPNMIDIGLGRTLSVCSGLGGSSIRDYDAALHDDDTWWATIYTANRYVKNGVDVASFQAAYGALFLVFNVDGDPNKARGYFKNIRGEMIDEFTIVRN